MHHTTSPPAGQASRRRVWHTQPPRPATQVHAIRVRPGKAADVESIAAVCGEAFGTGHFPGLEHPSLTKLEERYTKAIDREIKQKVVEALDRKQKAAAEHREYRLRRRNMQLRAQLAMLEGRTATFPTQPSPDERRKETRWLRSRQYVCLVAEDTDTQQVVGTVALTLAQPEALLPPPFPSSAPFRLYICNMAVREDMRRRGVARGLLAACLRLATLWGHDSIWLHVKSTKEGAIRLYTSEGFSMAPPRRSVPTFMALTGELLLRRALPQAAQRRARQAGQDMSVTAGQAGDSGDGSVAAAAEAYLTRRWP